MIGSQQFQDFVLNSVKDLKQKIEELEKAISRHNCCGEDSGIYNERSIAKRLTYMHEYDIDIRYSSLAHNKLELTGQYLQIHTGNNTSLFLSEDPIKEHVFILEPASENVLTIKCYSKVNNQKTLLRNFLELIDPKLTEVGTDTYSKDNRVVIRYNNLQDCLLMTADDCNIDTRGVSQGEPVWAIHELLRNVYRSGYPDQIVDDRIIRFINNTPLRQDC